MRQIGSATAAWSFLYGVFGVYWWLGGVGYSFGHSGRGSQFTLFANMQADVGAPVIAILGLAGSGAAMSIARGRAARRGVILPFAWMMAAVLLLAVPDARALVALAYAPVAIVATLIGHVPDDYRKAIPWPVLNQFVCVAGGLLWAATAVTYQRGAWSRGVDWMSPAAAARWGSWSTHLAVIIPLIYAATRWAWALGLPVGIDPQLLQQAQTTASGAWAGAVLGTVGIFGAALTLGLSQRWGETFPAWLPVVGGRSVPLAMAVVPASVVAVLVTSAGLTFWRRTLLGAGAFTLSSGSWAALGPELLWPIWGAALGAATLAYYVRRRGTGPALSQSR